MDTDATATHDATSLPPPPPSLPEREREREVEEAEADLNNSLTEMDWVVGFSSAFSHDCMLSPVRRVENPAPTASVISRADLETMMRVPAHVSAWPETKFWENHDAVALP